MNSRIKNEMMKMETFAKFPYLIEITHYLNDGTENIYRYANSDENIEFEGNVFNAGYFKITPPERSSNYISDAKLTISAVDQTWIQKIRETQKRAKVRFVAVIQYDDENGVEAVEPIEDIEFELTKANWNETEIQWVMEFDNLMDINVPIDEMTSLNCPQLG